MRPVLPSHGKQFVCELIPAENGGDVFEYESRAVNKIILRGNNGVSLAVAFNQFLRLELHLSYHWQANGPLKFFGRLPVATKVRHACLAHERFFQNYCTCGYTMPFWHWDQ
jgi:alpha-N-acetylglucosaminidase